MLEKVIYIFFFFGVDFKIFFDFRINNMNLFDVMIYYVIIDKRIIFFMIM